ncbi:MAG: hypothetical protein KGL38_02925 [Gemmatimonadota bacterium]|nr:hypothetical protein [Gemmatimonadota bacterium]
MRPSIRAVTGVAAFGALWFAASPAVAQSVLDHPPDILGTWTGAPGTLIFDLTHRFTTTGGSANKVLNSPTFLLGAPLPWRLMAGARYATNSLLVTGHPNAVEYFVRWVPLPESSGAPVDVAIHGAYNDASRSWDGEATVERRLGRLQLFGVGRAFSAFRRGDAAAAAGGGATLRLGPFVALAADAVSLVHRGPGEDIAWSAGLQLAIPYTPHTLSINVSNANTTTLEGASVGIPGIERWGFEFTIPIGLSRFVNRGSSAVVASPETAGSPIGAEVHLTDHERYVPDTVRIRAGQSVLWINGSNLVHTVTDVPADAAHAGDAELPAGAMPFDSGDLKPGMVFEYVFRVPGVYRYFCTPHEEDGMTGTVIVE